MTPEQFVQEAEALGLDGAVGWIADANLAAHARLEKMYYLILARTDGAVWITRASKFDYNRHTNPEMNGADGPFNTVAEALATYHLMVTE